MYEENPDVRGEREEVKAMRLWSDWNAGLRSWASSKVEKVFFSILFILSIIFCFICFICFLKIPNYNFWIVCISMRLKCNLVLFIIQFVTVSTDLSSHRNKNR